MGRHDLVGSRAWRRLVSAFRARRVEDVSVDHLSCSGSLRSSSPSKSPELASKMLELEEALEGSRPPVLSTSTLLLSVSGRSVCQALQG